MRASAGQQGRASLQGDPAGRRAPPNPANAPSDAGTSASREKPRLEAKKVRGHQPAGRTTCLLILQLKQTFAGFRLSYWGTACSWHLPENPRGGERVKHRDQAHSQVQRRPEHRGLFWGARVRAARSCPPPCPCPQVPAARAEVTAGRLGGGGRSGAHPAGRGAPARGPRRAGQEGKGNRVSARTQRASRRVVGEALGSELRRAFPGVIPRRDPLSDRLA